MLMDLKGDRANGLHDSLWCLCTWNLASQQVQQWVNGCDLKMSSAGHKEWSNLHWWPCLQRCLGNNSFWGVQTPAVDAGDQLSSRVSGDGRTCWGSPECEALLARDWCWVSLLKSGTQGRRSHALGSHRVAKSMPRCHTSTNHLKHNATLNAEGKGDDRWWQAYSLCIHH